ncbi:MAG TPA: VOC family protein, partial [Chitinophagaceae bacterium]|nr:VOC family protein [Chitinophagaceae bacterium]
DLKAAIPFYETIMGFRLISQNDQPYKLAVLERDAVQIGLAENGGDPTQEGCFFEVENVANAFEEFKANGLKKEISDFSTEKHGDVSWKVFYVVAPDGLCYCFGERQL